MAKRLLMAGAAAAALLGPSSAFAAVAVVQPVALSASAPAMGGPLMIGLALLLALSAFALLRRSTKFAAVAASMMLFATIAYTQPPTLVLSGPDCAERTVNPYNGDVTTLLRSDCPNPMIIVDLDPQCEKEMDVLEPRGERPCQIGDVLQEGDICRLPTCPD